MGLNDLINKYYENLNENDLYILNAVINDMNIVKNNTITKLSKIINVSSTSIIRVSKKLNFDGYSEFKYYIINELEDKKRDELIQREKTKNSILINDIKETVKLFEQSHDLDDIYKLLLESRRIFVYCTGYSQTLMVKEFSRCLLNNSIYINLIPTTTELNLIKEDIEKHDFIMFVSLSGNISNDIEKIIKTLKIKKVPILSITHLEYNKLSRLSDYNLYYKVSTLNTVKQLNTSSYLTLNVVLALLYEGLTNYIYDR